jgi:hypothetical protein
MKCLKIKIKGCVKMLLLCGRKNIMTRFLLIVIFKIVIK